MATPYLHLRIARRLKSLREKQGLTQQQLSPQLGFNDRQTLAAIEAGERQIAPAELAKAAELLGVTPDFFTDPFRLEGEGAFSFRAKDVAAEELDAFEARAGRWIATYRELGVESGVAPPRLGTKLELGAGSSWEDAHACADELRRRWALGDVPAAELEAAVERELGALVLNVDAPRGISGAASQLPGLHTILINRREPVGRRSYDLGHELFHVLTWDAMPPARVEPWDRRRAKGNRVEQLAEQFAAALLMPAPVVATAWERRGDSELFAWASTTAGSLRVSVPAFAWRLHNLGYITRAEVDDVRERHESRERRTSRHPVPPLFSRSFVARVHEGVESGRLSLRRAARLLDLEPLAFAETCRAYGLTLSYEM
jgi:Zn-dependent peptidase ImmA (M78 family)/transcriptional regulator with XRE-family HTH domain